jgi:hypothetical protein
VCPTCGRFTKALLVIMIATRLAEVAEFAAFVAPNRAGAITGGIANLCGSLVDIIRCRRTLHQGHGRGARMPANAFWQWRQIA